MFIIIVVEDGSFWVGYRKYYYVCRKVNGRVEWFYLVYLGKCKVLGIVGVEEGSGLGLRGRVSFWRVLCDVLSI